MVFVGFSQGWSAALEGISWEGKLRPIFLPQTLIPPLVCSTIQLENPQLSARTTLSYH